MKRYARIFLIIALFLFVLACNLGKPAPPPEYAPLTVPPHIETAVQATLDAANIWVSLGTPEPTLPPTVTPLPTQTPLPTFTFTPSIPIARVSVDTSCRSGPGKIYAYLGALMVGESAEVVGKHTATNYWIIKNPDAGGECWLWGEYASINGSTAHLSEYYVPPTPTPSIPAAPGNFTLASKNCGATMDITLSWTDNSLNEEGFSLYIDNRLTHIAGFNLTSVSINVPYTENQPIRFGLASFNKTGESERSFMEITCP